MLRSRSRGIESDRFISGRGIERENMIEKYKVKEVQPNPINSEYICKSADFKKRKSNEMMHDEKQISNKLYLSMLKNQIFLSENKQRTEASGKTYESSNKKRKILVRKERKSSQYEEVVREERNHYPEPEDKNTPQNKLKGSESKIESYHQLFNNFNTLQNEARFHLYNGELIKKQKLDFSKNYIFSNPSHKESFKSLINLDFNSSDSINYSDLFNKKNISKNPYKVLDAPNLKDDFYLHLLDWSINDVLAVGLENTVYFWEGKTSAVRLAKQFNNEKVTAVAWTPDGSKLIIGTQTGKINILDSIKNISIKQYQNHRERIGVVAPIPINSNLFSTGSQDHIIMNYDIRCQTFSSMFQGHSQEVCGLKWSHDGRMLASGGNDNKLILWSLNKPNPEMKFNAHFSAVKALGWSYQQYGLLASGGGTQDRTIKLWNTKNMKMIESIDTTSQVCNLTFSKITNEFVTTHGYSDNLILVWDFEKLEVIATLKGHKERVIYLSYSPDGRKIVTGAADETIRFWEVFKKEEISFSKILSPKIKNNQELKFR
jgi:cell division cycle 20-like protein 1 (cofactor of APC complex)